jgi:CelD/BcsL family acetyltransferase involved in cellulose biosynthesis
MVSTYSELLGPHVADWDRLALEGGTPFMTHAWLSCWWSAFGDGDPRWLVLGDADDGSLRAGALLHSGRGRLAAAANVHSGDWNGLARDEDARAELWAAVARQGAGRIHLQGLPDGAEGTRSACAELERAGYRVARVLGPFCPWLALAPSWEELIAAASSGLRQQVRRRRRTLEQAGSLTFRAVGGGPTLERDLDTFLKLEASGWKGKSGTAILSQPATERLYRDFAHAAAERGWLRLNLLELDGVVIAASYDCAFADGAFLLKTTFSEAHGRLSPGLVLLAEVLRSSIEEGLRSYDFLGDPDIYKTRWTSELRPRTQIWAYRGAARPGYLYRTRLRPLLKSVRDRTSAVRARAIARSSKADA